MLAQVSMFTTKTPRYPCLTKSAVSRWRGQYQQPEAAGQNGDEKRGLQTAAREQCIARPGEQGWL